MRVDVPRGARLLRVMIDESGVRKQWTLRLAEAPAAATVLGDARRMRRDGKLAEAASTLRAAMPTLAERDRADAMSLLGRIELARGERGAAHLALSEAAASHEANGRASVASDDASVLVALALEDRRFAEAREANARLARNAVDYAEGRAISDQYAGFIANQVTDLHAALRSLSAARERATRLGLDPLRRMVIQSTATQLLNLGRAAEALETLRLLEASDGAAMAPCDHADLLTNVGWVILIGRSIEANTPSFAQVDPEPWFLRALALYQEPCGRKWQRANVLANLTWAAIDRGDVDGARTHLLEARRVLPVPGTFLAFSLANLEVRIAIAGNHPAQALEACDRLTRLAAITGSEEDAWRAADLRAESLAALGRFNAALRASTEAEGILDRLSRGIPLGEGRDSFLGARERSARRRIELLLDRSMTAEALAAARQARARIATEVQRMDRVASLPSEDRARWEEALGTYRRARDSLAAEAQGDWALSQGALSKLTAARKTRDVELRAALDQAARVAPRAVTSQEPPASDEVLLAFYPLLHGWVAFAAHGDDVTAVRVPNVDPHASPDALALSLIEPHHARIAQARRVRILAYGALRQVDFHALPFEGAPLVEHAPVEYALDLGVVDTPSSGAAIVISDPSRDLPSARAEADAVSRALPPREVRRLQGRDATRSAVTTALGTSTLLHYAGHGVFGGRDGWESALPLAKGELLTVGDILALARVPRDIVLSGCETARSSAFSSPESLGLAQAFLAAGAAHVVAATRAIDDGATARLMSALYASASRQSGLDLAAALRDAQRALANASPPVDWAAFRALRR